MNDFCHGAAFVMTASGDRLTGSQVDDVACAGQKPIFDVSLRRPRSNGVSLPGRGIEIEAVGNDADLMPAPVGNWPPRPPDWFKPITCAIGLPDDKVSVV
jgi:hypothetical protein